MSWCNKAGLAVTTLSAVTLVTLGPGPGWWPRVTTGWFYLIILLLMTPRLNFSSLAAAASARGTLRCPVGPRTLTRDILYNDITFESYFHFCILLWNGISYTVHIITDWITNTRHWLLLGHFLLLLHHKAPLWSGHYGALHTLLILITSMAFKVRAIGSIHKCSCKRYLSRYLRYNIRYLYINIDSVDNSPFPQPSAKRHALIVLFRDSKTLFLSHKQLDVHWVWSSFLRAIKLVE